MPKFEIKELIDRLEQDVKSTLNKVEEIKRLPAEALLKQPEPGKWSIAQVLEHLNGYNRFYIAALEKGLSGGGKSISPAFKSGWFGNYFTNLMQPKADGRIGMKMAAPKEYNFGPDLDVERVVSEFVAGQQKLLDLLGKARNANLSVRVPISISKLIKLKAGDTFRFLVAHQQRHFLQVDRTRTAVLQSTAA